MRRSTSPHPKVCAVLFDRDETIVVDEPFNGDPDKVVPAPDARAQLDRLRAAGLPLAVTGEPLKAALAEAQRRGLAERDQGGEQG